MNDAPLMGVCDGSTSFGDELKRLRDGELILLDELAKWQAVNVLHRKVVTPVGLPTVVKSYDVGVFEGGHEFDLALEAMFLSAGSVWSMKHNLERDGSFGVSMDGFVDDALGAAVNFFEQVVAGEVEVGLRTEMGVGSGIVWETCFLGGV
jgi:hypothetical protein